MENLTGELDELPGEHTVMPSALPVNPQLGKLPMLSLVNTSKLSFVVPPLFWSNTMSGRVPRVVRTAYG